MSKRRQEVKVMSLGFRHFSDRGGLGERGPSFSRTGGVPTSDGHGPRTKIDTGGPRSRQTTPMRDGGSHGSLGSVWSRSCTYCSNSGFEIFPRA